MNWNLTLATNITDGYIIVAVQGYYPVTPSSVTWRGVNLTFLGGSLSAGSTAYVQFYGMPVGDLSSGTYGIGVDLTPSGPGIFLGGAMLFQGVNQTNPVGTVVSTNANAVSLNSSGKWLRRCWIGNLQRQSRPVFLGMLGVYSNNPEPN